MPTHSNCFVISARAGFPNFHSDGYYDGLYTYNKTGYSSPFEATGW
jgi:hypothetical protein